MKEVKLEKVVEWRWKEDNLLNTKGLICDIANPYLSTIYDGFLGLGIFIIMPLILILNPFLFKRKVYYRRIK
jgi:hypothetical protein